MEFTYFELFLIVFSSSFIIFSLAIRSESTRKRSEFTDNLKSLKEHIANSIKKKGAALKKNEKEEIYETVDARAKLFLKSLEQVNTYVYHSFYGVFFFAILGMGISLVTDMNIFLIHSAFNEYSVLLIWGVYFITGISLYFYARAAFVLILYTKFDYGYLEKLGNRIDEILGLKKLRMLDEENRNELVQIKIYVLRYIFFPFFLLVNNEFKQYFYRYYALYL